ncbi:SusF/SusE family outer membrane protein [Mucilaginibacter sp. 14171R-50]|uniref:SusE domain-containing protein n=1 Tax=Mucilaginibacter sp. 14171R-50 TaxID=2703789 RepID=UPI00138BAEFD|nr:SusE domain-containing protein [Mucilaginibacter sp. 14171R-50]QHS56836.1 SusF/SusE family outer membrane protein [Mucilaginibacter sp. 14171R-50]
MKSIFFKSFLIGLMTISLWSCKKEETRVVAGVSPAGALTASTTDVALNQANGAKEAFTISFPKPTVTGYQVPVTSTLQIDIKGNNFAKAKEMVVATGTYSPTVNQFNAMLLALGAQIGSPTEVEVRLKSGAAANAITYSNVITLHATPFQATSWIYVPGAYQGWDPKTADSLVSATSNGIYTGVIAYTAGNLEFKVTPAKAWDVAYGDAGGGTISTSGGNFNAGTEGLKQLTVDVNAKTWTIADVKSWGIIGDATPGGWDNDTDMKFVNDGKGTWKITLDLKAGAIKFRQDNKWDVNLGGSNGTLTPGGDNIAVSTAGNYTVTLNVTENTYTIVKN